MSHFHNISHHYALLSYSSPDYTAPHPPGINPQLHQTYVNPVDVPSSSSKLSY